MASSCRFVFIILAIVFPVIASAMDFIVGDEVGWTIGFDYQTWTKGKVFQVGDRLVGVHNVFKVNGTDFRNCTLLPPPSEALTSGNDIIVLATSGQKWYICGVGQHCPSGQKLFINVNVKLPWMAPSPSPSSHSVALPYSYNSTNGFTFNIFFTLMVMTVVVFTIFGF